MLPCRVCMGHRSAGKSMPTYPPTLSRFGSGCPVGYAWEAGERGRGTPGRLTAQYTTPPPPPPTSLLYAIHHTILGMAVSWENQGTHPNPASRSALGLTRGMDGAQVSGEEHPVESTEGISEIWVREPFPRWGLLR